MDEKWIFLLIINRDRIVTNFVGTSSKQRKPSPPPLQSSISMEILQIKGNLGKSIIVCSKGTKGCRLKHKQVRQQ